MRLVLDGALEIGLHVDAVRAILRRRLDGRRIELLARECGFDGLRAHGLGARARDADRRLRALAFLVERDDGRRADNGEARGRMRELQIGRPGAGGERGHADLDEQLVLAERGRHQALKPLIDLHGAASLRAFAHELRAHRDGGRGHVRGRIGVRERAADGALVPHLRIADDRGRLRHHRTLRLQHLRHLDLVMRRHGPDGDHGAVFLDARETGHLAQVDEVLGLREPELHHGHEAVATREDLGVFELAEKPERFLDGGGSVIFERGRIHGGAFPIYPSRPPGSSSRRARG
jgi:hypothetical protein